MYELYDSLSFELLYFFMFLSSSFAMHVSLITNLFSFQDETQRRADEEDRKRKELSQKFQTTINDITNQMGENHKRNQQLKQDNSE